jgi:hypothetical protein
MDIVRTCTCQILFNYTNYNRKTNQSACIAARHLAKVSGVSA